jgi:hypothetical protein
VPCLWTRRSRWQLKLQTEVSSLKLLEVRVRGGSEENYEEDHRSLGRVHLVLVLLMVSKDHVMAVVLEQLGPTRPDDLRGRLSNSALKSVRKRWMSSNC